MAKGMLDSAARLARQGRLTEAESLCRQELRARPGSVVALKLLGRLTRDRGDLQQSQAILQQLFRARPHDPEAAGELGATFVKAGRPSHALPLLQRAAEAMPDSAEWRRWIGRAHLRESRPAAAERSFKEAQRIEPGNPENTLLLATSYLTGGWARKAEELLLVLAAEHPDHPGLWHALAQALENLGDPAGALECYRRALANDPQGEAHAGVVRCLHAQGRTEEALGAARADHERSPTAASALTLARMLLATRAAEPALALLDGAMAPEHTGPGAIALWFARAEALEALGRYDEAFDAYSRANALYPKAFSRARLEERHAALTSAHAALKARGLRASADGSPCVFVVGMPRSGTTLVEQILDAHPDAHGCGELLTLEIALREAAAGLDGPFPASLGGLGAPELERAARAYLDHVQSLGGACARLVDKLPHNFEFLGMIERMLPGARVIHCVRSPLDVCVSCYATQLSPAHDYATDLANLGVAFAASERLMRRWRETTDLPTLEVRYEDVVADLESQARRIIEFVGLPWDDACLEFWRSGRTVATASVEQVRRPIYSSSVGRWRRFERHVAPLAESLRREGVEPW